jgi:hypothetical protein
MTPRHHEFEIDRAGAGPAPSAHPPEVKTQDEGDLLPLFAFFWALCAVSVVVSLVHPPFDLRATVSLAGLVVLPLLVRRTIWRVVRRRDR